MTHVWLTRKDASRLEAVAKHDGHTCTVTPWGSKARVSADGGYLRSLGLTPGAPGLQRLGGEFDEAERWAKVKGEKAI
jgi:hypothetical protein